MWVNVGSEAKRSGHPAPKQRTAPLKRSSEASLSKKATRAGVASCKHMTPCPNATMFAIGVAAYAESTAGAHVPTTPSKPSSSSRRSERPESAIAKSKGAPLDFPTLDSASARAAASMPTATPRETAASSPRAPMPSAIKRQSGCCTSKKRDSAAASKTPASSKSSGHMLGVKRNTVCPCRSNALFAQNAGDATPAPMRAMRTILQ